MGWADKDPKRSRSSDPQAPEMETEPETHDLKTWPVFFEAIADGRKTFEARINDRGYAEGDTLHLREWDPDTEEYTGREVRREVSYLLDSEKWACPGTVIMGLRALPDGEPEPKGGTCAACGHRRSDHIVTEPNPVCLGNDGDCPCKAYSRVFRDPLARTPEPDGEPGPEWRCQHGHAITPPRKPETCPYDLVPGYPCGAPMLNASEPEGERVAGSAYLEHTTPSGSRRFGFFDKPNRASCVPATLILARTPEPSPEVESWAGSSEPCEACGSPPGVACPESSAECRAFCSCPTCGPEVESEPVAICCMERWRPGMTIYVEPGCAACEVEAERLTHSPAPSPDVVGTLRTVLDLGDDIPAPEHASYEPDRECFDLEWIVAKGWRMSVSVHLDGTLAWAAILGDDRRKGTDMAGLLEARAALADTEETT